MPLATLKKTTEELGVSFDDTVYYYVKDDKGIIEISLTASNMDIKQSSVHDISNDYLSQEEPDYYLSLDDK